MNPVGWVKKQFEDVSGGMVIFGLVVLFFLYFFDEFDTAAFATLAPEIEHAFHLSDRGFAILVILNLSIVLLAALPVGYYGDRLPRTKLVVAGAIAAGVFSFGTGLAPVLGLLVLARLGNGVGLMVNDPI